MFVCVFVLIEEWWLDVLFVIRRWVWSNVSVSFSSVPERPDAPGLFPVNERSHLQMLDAEELTVVMATSCRANLPTHSILCVCVCVLRYYHYGSFITNALLNGDVFHQQTFTRFSKSSTRMKIREIILCIKKWSFFCSIVAVSCYLVVKLVSFGID